MLKGTITLKSESNVLTKLNKNRSISDLIL